MECSFIFQREKGVLGGYLAGETGEETQRREVKVNKRGGNGEEWGGRENTPGMDTNRKKGGIKRRHEKGGNRVKEKYLEGGRAL